ncbi:Protein TIC 214 [Rhizoctonia solani]|uniref:Protein TIC 214 n=1 Tax=Rhizoctonia solani TaxID=456999 RepID=A0A0K6G3Z1_9AGAM|nr:Protein TIC 214 [Rhizoctonia solani]
MSYPLFWPGKYFFYPMGITAAKSLTQDLSPEQSADILILGCGDPSDILFTLYSDLTIGDAIRKVDITCSEVEAAILGKFTQPFSSFHSDPEIISARNILLFSTLADNTESSKTIWEVFYHFKVSDDAVRVIQTQSQKLEKYAQDIQSWRQSPYGSFLKMVDTRTLAELRLHWKNYADFSSLPHDRTSQLYAKQKDLSKAIAVEGKTMISTSRSAGMLWNEALYHLSDMFAHYWKTGTTYITASDIQKATNLNPTFCYSRSGEMFDPHYGTFPQSFHFGPAYVPITEDPVGTLPNIGSPAIEKAKQQFAAWCLAFHAARAANAIIIRFYFGDPLPFCHALATLKATGKPSTGLFSGAYRATQIMLDELARSDPHAPLNFDVIDTSSLVDHVGLLNLLIVTPDLLKTNPTSQSVIYTESILQSGKDFTKGFQERLCTDIPTFAALFGVAPRSYVSTFTAESNVHELIFSDDKVQSLFGPDSGQVQFQERTVWTNPYSGDSHAYGKRLLVTFEADHLAVILLGIYDKMLEHERISESGAPRLPPEELKRLSWVNYNRESVAQLFKVVQRRIELRSGGWNDVIAKFIQMARADQRRPAEGANYRDMVLQLHLAGVMTFDELTPNWYDNPGYRPDPSKRSGVLTGWKEIPPIVCVVLTVPRRRLTEVFGGPIEKVGTPYLVCCIQYRQVAHNISVPHAVWGRIIKSQDSDRVVIEEDPKGKQGHSDLIVSFWAPTRTVEELDTTVDLRLKPTMASVLSYYMKLPKLLEVFTAKMTDKQHVTILPYRPTLSSEPAMYPAEWKNPPDPDHSKYQCNAIVTENFGQSVTSLFVRFTLQALDERLVLLQGATVGAKQIGPCTMELKIGSFTHSLLYCYPIQGKDPRIRIARKSGYIEVIVPISAPSDPSGYFMNPFPVLGKSAYFSWNIHHVNLDRLPLLDTTAPSKLYWVEHLCKHQLSAPEKAIRDGSEVTRQQAVHARVNFKSSIHSLAQHYLGENVQQSRIITLCDKEKNRSYAMLFIGGIRMDLASMTIAFDTAVVPMTNDEKLLNSLLGLLQIENPDSVVRILTGTYETIAWKKALPAFIERCRSWSHKPACEYRSYSRIPLSIDPNKKFLCSCGQGVGFNAPQWSVPGWQGFIPLATRAAICPIFSLSYLETVVGNIDEYVYGRLGTTIGNCQACGGRGKPNLEMCSRCKGARYCSRECQRVDWPIHKKGCKPPDNSNSQAVS